MITDVTCNQKHNTNDKTDIWKLTGREEHKATVANEHTIFKKL